MSDVNNNNVDVKDVNQDDINDADVQTNSAISPVNRLFDSYNKNKKSTEDNSDNDSKNEKDVVKESSDRDNKNGKVQKYDYSFFKDLKDEDYKKYEHIKDEGLKYELLSHLNDMKKYQRLVAERERAIEELKKQNPNERLAKYEEFIEEMKKDALGAYRKYQKDFDLPDATYFENQLITQGDVQTRLAQWQENDLIPQIEKKYKIEPGTFVYDPSEAYKAGTPSYEYRIQTEKKEKALLSEYENTQKQQREVLEKIKQQNDADLKYLRETFYPDNKYGSAEEADKAFVEALKKLDELQAKNAEGFDPANNLFSLKNIFRGVLFDELLERAVNEQVKKIHEEYNSRGMYLPAKDNPTDVNSVKGGNAVATGTDDVKRKFSPMFREISRHKQ